MTEPNVIRTWNIGFTMIKVADDYIAKEPEEIKKILDNVAYKSQRNIAAKERS